MFNIFQIATILMKHEGFDFTKNVWDEKIPKSDELNAWAGNIAVPHLIFDDKQIFEKNLGEYFSIDYEKLTECLIFYQLWRCNFKNISHPFARDLT